MFAFKRFLVAVTSFALLAMGLSWEIGIAQAVGAGTAITGIATEVTANGVTLNGTVTHTGSEYTTVFAIGTKADLSDPVFTYSGSSWENKTLYIRAGVGGLSSGGTSPMSFDFHSWTPSGDGSPLQPSTTYYFRAGIQDGPDNPNCVWSYACYSWGSVATFTTRAAILPSVSRGVASLVGANTAQISGNVISNDAATSVSVEYGKLSDLSGPTQMVSGRPNDVMNQCSGSDCNIAPASTSMREITRGLTLLDPETRYYYRIVAMNTYGTVRGEINSFVTTPPVGVTINSGANYTTSKNVSLDISWPVGATGMSISNDGGFRAGSVINAVLRSTYDWTIDDSVQGVYTKIIYIRFSGQGIDASRTYSDDIIFDNKNPVVITSKVEEAGSYIVLTLAATDEESGLSIIEINNADKTVSADYASTVLVKASDLGLGVGSSAVRKSSLKTLRIRISDRAGNKTSWILLGKAISESATAPRVTKSKSASAKSIAVFAKLKVLSTSKVSLKVVRSSVKYCRVLGTTLKGLKAGSCKVTVTVTPKKGRATSKTVTLKVAK